MSYTEQWTLYTDPQFRGRVAMALVKAAMDVRYEGATTPDHGLRLRLADGIVQNPESYVPAFMPYIASNTTIAAAGPINAPDGDIDFVVATNFTSVATIA